MSRKSDGEAEIIWAEPWDENQQYLHKNANAGDGIWREKKLTL